MKSRGVQAHISRTICTCRYQIGFRHHNQPNQNQLNSRDEFNMILFVSSIFVLTFLQFFCFTHGYMINKSFLHVKVVNAVSFASLNWGYLLYIQRWRRHHLRNTQSLGWLSENAFNHCFESMQKVFQVFQDFILVRKSIRKTSHYQ